MAEIGRNDLSDKAGRTGFLCGPAASPMPVQRAEKHAAARPAAKRERLSNISLTPREEHIFELAEPYLRTKENQRHTTNALAFAIELLQRYAGDRDVVAPAVILHDVGCGLSEKSIAEAQAARADRLSLVRMHEKEGVRIARDILREAGCDTRTATEIIAIIDGHDTRISSLSLNDEIVKDADKLTRYSGSFGFVLQESGMPRNDFVALLEYAVDKWFFLDLSREMARSELAARRTED
jgi:HD superfamily phosphohydrolase YqeK